MYGNCDRPTVALAQAWEEKRMPRGASTITQQLARNLYLSPEGTLTRKAREAAIAVRMESELSKHRILELYLNVIELGDGIFGVKAASARCFALPAGRLSRRQAADTASAAPALGPPPTAEPLPASDSVNFSGFRLDTVLGSGDTKPR